MEVIYSVLFIIIPCAKAGTPWAKTGKGDGIPKFNRTGQAARNVQAGILGFQQNHAVTSARQNSLDMVLRTMRVLTRAPWLAG